MELNNTKKTKLWIESNRWLLYFFASKNPMAALLFVLPLMIFWFIKIDFTQLSLISFTSFFAVGVLSWTFLEYCIHRFLFHWHPKNIILKNAIESIHIYHHRNLEDQGVITSGPVFAIFWSFINFMIYYFFTSDLVQSSVLMLGLTFAYYIYECVHFLVHHYNFSSGPLKYLQDYHLLHHERWGGNFGQTSPLWDIVLGTSLTIKKIEVEKKKKYIFLYQNNLKKT